MAAGALRAVRSAAKTSRACAPLHNPANYVRVSYKGLMPGRLEVFAPNGRAFRFPAWSVDRVLQPWIVRRGIYRGVRSGPGAGGDAGHPLGGRGVEHQVRDP